MMVKGMIKQRSGGFARGTGMAMVIYLMIADAAILLLLLLDLCNPDLIGTEIREVCKPRFTPEGIATVIAALTAAMGATTYGIYKENKKAETAANGSG
jgi:hypothetical protein